MRLTGWKEVCAGFLFCVATVIASQAQVVFTTITTFNGNNGENPQSAPIQGLGGNLYGVTSSTAYRIEADGKLSTIHAFCSQPNCIDGRYPEGPLVQTADGSLYGTTEYGGANNDGEVFQVAPNGKFSVLYSFGSSPNSSDGSVPLTGVTIGLNGNLYGVTSGGGAYQLGSVFELTRAGKLTTLHSFCSSDYPLCLDGAQPYYAPLVLASNGKFYGTTSSGGSEGVGVVFEISAAGEFNVIHNFCSLFNCTDGDTPYSGLVEGGNGKLYGTTYYGGTNCLNGSGCGVVYEITFSGEIKTLYSFCSQSLCSDGLFPVAGVVEGSDGNLYGTASQGGLPPTNCLSDFVTCGTVFQLTPQGTLTVLHNFCSETNCSDGGDPSAGLLQATNGIFYGSTFAEGDLKCAGGIGCGTLYSVSTGLEPFIKAQIDFGRVGQVVNILGNTLSGATSVTFDGLTAEFKVESDSRISAEVPSGATTGSITVTTPSDTLTSNVPFYVLP